MTSWTGGVAERPWTLKAYEAAARLAQPLSGLVLARRAMRGKENPARIGERRGVASAARPEGTLVWVHGASVGEMLSALPLAEALGKLYPHVRLLLTSGTVTSAAVMETRAPDNAVHQHAPLDLPPFIDAFLDHWRPDLALFVESELWPNMLGALSARDIPAMLLNARMSEKSAARWRRAPRTIRWLLGRFEAVLAQTKADADRFAYLGARHARVAGNLKFDAPAPPADNEALAALKTAFGARPVLAAASTHSGEDETLALVHEALARATPGLLTVIAPRHPERGAAIAGELVSRGLKCRRRAAGEAPEADTAIYVADTLGELGLIYRASDLVFMGGSLVPHGGQNPIEPAKLGLPVLHGPHVFNFADVYASLDEAGGARQVAGAGELEAAAGALLKDAAARGEMGKRARNTIEATGGALTEILAALAPRLGKV